jgi:hypothetical protein
VTVKKRSKRGLRKRYGHGRGGPHKFVEYLVYADGKRANSDGPAPGTWYRSRKAAVEAADALVAKGYAVEVKRRTHSAVEPYKRVNISLKGGR